MAAFWLNSSIFRASPRMAAAKRDQRLAPAPLWLAPKLALYLAMRNQQVNNSELARRLGVHERVIRRMLDPEHASKAKKFRRLWRLWASR
jgi:antitoxin HicB